VFGCDGRINGMGSVKGLSPNQKKFIELVSNGTRPSIAYVQAGYTAKTNQVAKICASKLINSPKVSKELAYRKKLVLDKNTQRARKLAKRLDVNQDWLIGQLIDTIEGAKLVNQWGNVRACIWDIAKLTGHAIDRRELSVQGSISNEHLMAIDSTKLLRLLDQSQQETTGTNENIISNGASVAEDTIDAEFRKADDDAGDPDDEK